MCCLSTKSDPIADVLLDMTLYARITCDIVQTCRLLDELVSNDSQPHGSLIGAEGYLKKLKQLRASILLELWNAILNKFYKTNLSCEKAD